MISCEQCQNKLAAIFDNEGSKSDEELTEAHLKECPECRAFYDDMVKLRKQFNSAAVPCLSKTVEMRLMQTVRADSLRRENRRQDNRTKYQPRLLRLPTVTRVAGLAGLFVLIVSLLTCYSLRKEVVDLRGRLQALQRDLTAARQELAVAQTAEQLEEDREREQKAISALYFRMRELEERFDRYYSPGTTFMPAQQKTRSDRPGDM